MLLAKAPEPRNAPIPLVTLYRTVTKDAVASEASIRHALKTDSAARQMVVSLCLAGYSLVQIGAAMGVTGKAVSNRARKAMVRAWKQINAVPRYYKVGRKVKEQA